MTRIPVIETERLRLRGPQMADFEAYAAYCASDNSRTVGGPFTRSGAWQRLEAIAGQWLLRGFGRWIVADRETETALGVVGLYYPESWPEPEIAWTVFPDAEGKGVAFEAAKAARAHAYDVLGWKRAVSCISGENPRSEALAKRMGCTHVDDFDHPEYGVLNVWLHPAPEALQ